MAKVGIVACPVHGDNETTKNCPDCRPYILSVAGTWKCPKCKKIFGDAMEHLCTNRGIIYG